MNTVVLKRAKHYLADLRDRQRWHDEMVEQDRAEGHRPHYCIHGTNQWVDYDNICGPCEDGMGRYEGLVLYRLALDWARTDWTKAQERTELVGPLLAIHGPDKLPYEVAQSLIDWALKPIISGLQPE